MLEPLKIGIAGFGTVGSGLAEVLKSGRQRVMDRTGRDIVISMVAERNEALRPAIESHGATMTTDWKQMVANPDIQVIVELIGGTTVARELIIAALNAGKHVVTANKALLAEYGNELFPLATKSGVHLGFEASVAGGIPVLDALRGGLAGNRIRSLIGILNGTANFILTEMSTRGLDFGTALKMAQDKGFAEADPTLDIEGIDAAHKLTLLIQLALGRYYALDKLPVTGVTVVDSMDIGFAKEFGYAVKLIAQAKEVDGKIEAGVYPALVPQDYLLAAVQGSFNAIRFDGDAGPVLLHGHGAGDLPTGSAVLADIMSIARGEAPNILGFIGTSLPDAEILDLDEAVSQHYVRFIVPDQPGVLRDIAGILADNDISLHQVIQKGRAEDDESVPLVFLTHEATANAVHNAMRQADEQGLTRGKTMHYRIL
ncbi:MAG: homoserine dehydrogenase [Proteobacteria bacterium]|nr:homoserine dehydrogenase [Pseudomonadota bacterium]